MFGLSLSFKFGEVVLGRIVIVLSCTNLDGLKHTASEPKLVKRNSKNKRDKSINLEEFKLEARGRSDPLKVSFKSLLSVLIY